MAARLLLLAGLLGLVLAALPASATNTGKEVVLRVVLHDGTVHDGEVEVDGKKLEVKAGRRLRLRYPDVAAITGVPAPSAEDLERARADFRRQGERLAAEDAAGWTRLGRSARRHGLEAEARSAFERAVAAQPDLEDARNGLGLVRDGAAWVDGVAAVESRRRALARDDVEAHVALARYALDHELTGAGYDLLSIALRLDAYHARALDLMRPLTDAYRQRVTLSLPFRGRWLALPDGTRHHARKAFAVYALDLVKVDAEGRAYRGAGRTREDYHGFGQDVYAAAPGRVVEVRDGFPDNDIGVSVPEKHNGVSIDHGNGEATWYIHLRNGSIPVREGQDVERGQVIGQVGSSGGSATPHLHVTLVLGGLSVPWTIDRFTLVAPDGTPLPVRDAWPREGWTIESP